MKRYIFILFSLLSFPAYSDVYCALPSGVYCSTSSEGAYALYCSSNNIPASTCSQFSPRPPVTCAAGSEAKLKAPPDTGYKCVACVAPEVKNPHTGQCQSPCPVEPLPPSSLSGLLVSLGPTNVCVGGCVDAYYQNYGEDSSGFTISDLTHSKTGAMCAVGDEVPTVNPPMCESPKIIRSDGTCGPPDPVCLSWQTLEGRVCVDKSCPPGKTLKCGMVNGVKACSCAGLTECEPGTVKNAFGNCVPDKTCPDGQVKNSVTNLCEAPKDTCPAGYYPQGFLCVQLPPIPDPNGDRDNDGTPNVSDPDRDGDGQPNDSDPTPNGPSNPDDRDGDGTPNASDPTPDGSGLSSGVDLDGDGIPNGSDPDQDGDGIPNASDPDRDGDGIPNASDPAPDGPSNSDDRDGDGIPNASDSTPDGPSNPDDRDGDGIPNASDPDRDGDGIPNASDPMPDGPGVPTSTDRDGDGIPNGQDSSPDGPGSSHPLGPDGQGDRDGDGVPNSSDPDRDGDGVPNNSDTSPDGPGSVNPDLTGTTPPINPNGDSDGDGIPNGSDPDRDGDGIPNGSDGTPDGNSDKDGDGSPDGQCNPAIETCGDGGPGAPVSIGDRFYESRNLKFSDVWSRFISRVQSARIVTAGSSFFSSSGLGGGSCPTWEIPSTAFFSAIPITLQCSSEITGALSMAGWMVLAAAAWVAFRIALL